MAYTVDFSSSRIEVTYPQTDVAVQDLIEAVRSAEASAQGIAYGQITNASGKESLGPNVAVGITVELLGDWQLHFWAGDYIAKVSGGNLVGGPGGDPIAYSDGVQVILIQSAASTLVLTGEGLSTDDKATLTQILAEAKKARQMAANKAVVASDGSAVTIYDDDGTTVLHRFDISSDKLQRVPA